MSDTFCFSRPKLGFCEDFDAAELPGAFETMMTRGGQLVVDGVDSTTAPRSVTMESLVDGADVGLATPAGPAVTYKAFFQVRIEAAPATGEVELFSLEVGEDRFSLLTDAQGALFSTHGATRWPSARMPTGDWASVRFDVVTLGDATTLSVKIGDEIAINRKAIALSAAQQPGRNAVGLLGGAAAGWKARFDTITFIQN